MRRSLLCAAALLLFAGCSPRSGSEKASTLTEAQRDSVLARSSLPGAGVVDRALKVSGQEAGRAAKMDSLGQ